MIVYRKVWWGFPLLFRLYGSAFPRVLPFIAISAAFTVAFHTFGQHYNSWNVANWWRDAYPFVPFSTAVAFILVFRQVPVGVGVDDEPTHRTAARPMHAARWCVG